MKTKVNQSVILAVAAYLFCALSADAETIEVVKAGESNLLSSVRVDLEESGNLRGLSDRDMSSYTDGNALVLASPTRDPIDNFVIRVSFGPQFKLKARMAIDQAHNSASGLFFFGHLNDREHLARFMFNSKDGMLWVWGILFDACMNQVREQTAPQVVTDGQWFDLEIEAYPAVREGKSHFVLRINNEEVVNTVAPSGLVQRIGFAPARAVMKIESLGVEGDVTISNEDTEISE